MPALSTFAALPSIAPNLPLKLPRDFIPIGYTAENPMFFAVTPSLGVSTLAELIALAKKEPGKISIAVTGVGRLTHMTGLVFQDRADISLLPVPYNGGPAAALADVVGGRVSMIIEGYSGHRRFGQSRAGEADRGGVAASACRSFPICRPWRKPSRDFPQPAGKCWWRRSARRRRSSARSARTLQSRQRSGFQEAAQQYRQLFARHDAGGGSRLRAEGAGHLAAGAAEDFAEVKRFFRR